MLERATLNTGEHGRVDQRRHLADFAFLRGLTPRVVEVFTQQDDTAARTAQGLVGCRGYNVGILDGVVEQACGDKTGGMGHVDHQDRTYFVGKATHTGIIPFAAVGAGTTDYELRAFTACYFFHLVVVDCSGVFFYVIFESLEHETREVHGASVAEVTAVAEVETEEFVAGLKAGHENSHICLSA